MSAVHPPTFIPLPPPPAWPAQHQPSDSDSAPSPAPNFYTPPTSPTPSPAIFYTPPTSPFHDLFPQTPSAPPVFPPAIDLLPDADQFPPNSDVPIDLALDDEGLSTLEKIYLYSRSKASFHRIFIAHSLPDYLLNVTPQEAVEYVLPLLSGLAMDEEDQVKNALAGVLVPVIWWFFTHCQITPDDLRPEEAYASSSTTVTISVQAFTPILGTLLLCSNRFVHATVRMAIVELLSRMKKVDDKELGAFHNHQHHSPAHIIHPWEKATNDRDDDVEEEDAPPFIGLFGTRERGMFTQEILQQVVIGMARLDFDLDPEEAEEVVSQLESPSNDDYDRSNPYFPPISSTFSQQSPTNYPSWSPTPTSPEPSPGSPRSPPLSRNDIFPNAEFPPTAERSLPSPPLPTRSSEPTSFAASGSQTASVSSTSNAPGSLIKLDIWEDIYDIYRTADQGTVGRLASMSLMASVVAGGALDNDTLVSFVQEVERVVRDPISLVRREASFALGALAKVVSEEMVPSSLLPVFDLLRWDAMWHVRHSALYALPAILTRISPAQRRTLALETIVALSTDQNPTVRSGALEVLGEVLHTFIGDSGGPPEELMHLFLGRQEDRRVRVGQEEESDEPQGPQTPLEAFYTDPKRPLICAFNFPAVALTLGAHRWEEIRQTYLDIALNPDESILQTLAASLGELAKIIGPENAWRDLLGIYGRTVRHEDREVRLRVLDSLRDFISVIGSEVGMTLVQGLLTAWNEGVFVDWRDREQIEKNLVSWAYLLSTDAYLLLCDLFMHGLEDSIAAVRATAISSLPGLWTRFSSNREVIKHFRDRLKEWATSEISRKRMIFIGCQLSLVDGDARPVVSLDEDFIRSVADLANDEVEGVRIGVSRFAAAVYRNLLRQSRPIPAVLHDLAYRLSQDSSHEVRLYIAGLLSGASSSEADLSASNSKRTRESLVREAATFSRPPLSFRPASPAQQQADTPQVSSPGLTPVPDRIFSGEEAGNILEQRHSASSQSSSDQLQLGTASALGERNPSSDSVLANGV